MSKSTNASIEAYVAEKMPKRVKEALSKAMWNLHHGAADPNEDIGATWEKNSGIVEDWFNTRMNDDLVVDDAGNVSTGSDFERYLEQLYDEREKEALQEAIDEGIGDDEEDESDADEAKEKYAEQQARAWAESEQENSTRYDASYVKRLVLGRDWPS
jgi:hypothetical protein